MAINTDGPKKQGRFIKKGSRILTAVSLVDFNFEEICTHPLVTFDNPDRSIIHSRFHEPQQLSAVIKQHESLDTPVADVNKPRLGVIFPADFTQDWHNERINSKRRNRGLDDEDEDENIDFAEAARTRTPMRTPGDLPSTDEVRHNEDAIATQLEKNIASTQVATMSAHPISPDEVSAADADGKIKSMSEGDMATAIDKAFTNQPQSESVPGKPRTNAQDSVSTFTPLPTGSEAEPVAAEDRAIETWKTQQNIAKQNEQILEELKSNARSEGFQNGFREGEEKGLISGQKKAAQVFSKVEEIISEFEGLKSLVLDNVQKNFYELSQAIGEALLGREFSIKPEAYATMIQRVIKDTISPNEFKVRMHPETWQRVHDLGIGDLNQHLVKDPSISPGEFRVESALTVVDVSAKKLVQQLLEKADINLFDEKKVS